MTPMCLYDVHFKGTLVSSSLQLFGKNVDLDKVATDLFLTKARLILPNAFVDPETLKLVRLTRLPLVVSIRPPLDDRSIASVPNMIDEAVFFASLKQHHPHLSLFGD